MIPFVGDLTQFLPTWKADITDPYPNSYDDNSVGFWIRAGNLVWFSVSFFMNSSGVNRVTNGEGYYFWNPAIDGLPPIDANIYNNTEGQSMVCGTARFISPPGFLNPDGMHSCEIGGSSSKIYIHWRALRTSPTRPSVWEEDEGVIFSGKYVTQL